MSVTANQAIQNWLGELDSTGAAKVIDIIHHEVHEGELFTAEFTKTAVANGGTVQMVMTTGTKQPHLAFTVQAGGACQVYLYEGATAAGGTAMPIFNNNRLSANAPLSSFVHSPTSGTAGTVSIANGRYLVGGDSAQTRVGGAVRPNVEYALGTSTKYMVNVVNVSGGAITISTIFEFYEETL